MEPDLQSEQAQPKFETFQSTGSVWSPTVVPALFVFYEVFQSTGSVWSPTRVPHLHRRGRAFSIHGLRVEPDPGSSLWAWPYMFFNPRAPCGARREFHTYTGVDVPFQSTGSVWSPTIFRASTRLFLPISIHGLRVEPDGLRSNASFLPRTFQSTGSVWSPTDSV